MKYFPGIMGVVKWALLLLLLQGCAVIVFPSLYPRKSGLQEIEVESSEGWFVSDKILLVDISGFISSSESRGLLGSSTNLVDDMKEILRMAEKDANIRALILRINTPGGEVTASDIIYEELMDFKKKTGKAVVAEMMGMATSGGYYIAMAADRIYAHPTSLTGNIGVVSIFPRLQELSARVGIDVRVVKSGDKKDIGSMWREFTTEERNILQSLIDDYYNQFLERIGENRKNLERDKIKELADGRVYTARQALEAGLIDGIAYLPEAIKKAQIEAGVSDASVIMYKRSHQYRENIYSMLGGANPEASKNTQIGLINVDAQGLSLERGPQFLYLWLP
ncbi:signal peptide peptidase SppA [Candidatus Sumerlaeota bacterium]|nr:signal peptide peptidase SppA [Candidatus Sumerlaeota bacterium]